MATMAPPETCMHNTGRSSSCVHDQVVSLSFEALHPSAVAATAPHAAVINALLVICFAIFASVLGGLHWLPLSHIWHWAVEVAGSRGSEEGGKRGATRALPALIMSSSRRESRVQALPAKLPRRRLDDPLLAVPVESEWFLRVWDAKALPCGVDFEKDTKGNHVIRTSAH